MRHPERDEASVVCEDKMSVLGVHTYRISIRKASSEQLSRQLVEQQMLYGTLYGTSSEVRVKPSFRCFTPRNSFLVVCWEAPS